MKAAEASLAVMGARRVTLIVSNENHGAQVFFKRLGYSISMQRDVVVFEKIL
ncbi:MAG: hypothetical protein FGF51_03510 [Candidatus Brockarchaeota archaeon]|nr:hypothetical protein [Candidatus Brockarchaeota archaeon]